eukprot:1996398-Pyramimonas_sp.AAC.1
MSHPRRVATLPRTGAGGGARRDTNIALAVATRLCGRGRLFTVRGFCLRSGVTLEGEDAGPGSMAPLRRILLESSPPTNMAEETHRLASYEVTRTTISLHVTGPPVPITPRMRSTPQRSF